MYLALYLLALVALALHAPPVWPPGALAFVTVLALFGAWPFGWGAIHLARALIYRRLVFPHWRRDAEARAGTAPAAIYLMIAGDRLCAETTLRVCQAALAEALRHGGPATIVAGIVEPAEQRAIKRLFARLQPPAGVRLLLVRPPATGERHGLACALRAVARNRPGAGAAVVVVGGDTLLTPGLLARSLPFLRLMPEVDGIAADQDAIVAGGPARRAWRALRCARRHQLMSSAGLGRRLPALSWRLAIYRAAVATDPDFIAAVERDHLEHWRLGRIELLTGAHHSAWFWLLRRGRAMLYLPDVRVIALEQPAGGRLAVELALIRREAGDPLRAEARAPSLGPRRLGFVWWCLLERRISLRTTLAGPAAAAIFMLGNAALFLYIYLLWVGVTRLVQALILLTARPRLSGLQPPLLYLDQIGTALLESHLLCHLDRQRPIRHRQAARPPPAPGRHRLQPFVSTYLHLLALGTVVAVAALAIDLVSPPELAAGGRF